MTNGDRPAKYIHPAGRRTLRKRRFESSVWGIKAGAKAADRQTQHCGRQGIAFERTAQHASTAQGPIQQGPHLSGSKLSSCWLAKSTTEKASFTSQYSTSLRLRPAPQRAGSRSVGMAYTLHICQALANIDVCAVRCALGAERRAPAPTLPHLLPPSSPPACCSAFGMASEGAVGKSRGSPAASPNPSTRPTTGKPYCRTARPDASTTAAAPSVIGEALPAAGRGSAKKIGGFR